jgi:hypothetical protein
VIPLDIHIAHVRSYVASNVKLHGASPWHL